MPSDRVTERPRPPGAARLESANKHLGTRIAISGETVKRVPGFRGRPVGRIVLKGKTEAIEVYEPWSDVTSSAELSERYNQAYDLLDECPQQALKAFDELSVEFPDDPVVGLHRARLKSGETGAKIIMDEK